MATTRLNELLIDEKQHLIYTFDMLAGRMFFMELSQIIPKQNLDEPVGSRQQGNPPPQRLDFDQLMNIGPSISLDSDSYIDDDMISEGYDEEEISDLDITDGDF